MKNEKRVTAKIIAKELGLSIATVDRALNNRGNVKKETVERIMQKAKELDYTPNRLASSLSKKQHFSIAVIFPEYPEYFWKHIEIGIYDAYSELRDYGLSVQTFTISDQDLSKGVKVVKEILNSGDFDAIAIAAGEDIFVDIIDEAMEKNIPVCTFNHDSPTSRRLFYVGSDYRITGRLAAELLCKLTSGSSRIAIIKTVETSYQIQEKLAGFREVFMEYPRMQLVGPLKMDRVKIEESLIQLKEQLFHVDGIYVANAELGNVARYIDNNIGTNKPVVIGHDLNDQIFHYLTKDVITATIKQDPRNQGYLAVKRLFKHLTDPGNASIKDDITNLEIVMRENAKYHMTY